MNDIEKKELFRHFWFLGRIVRNYQNVNEIHIRNFSPDILTKRGGLKDCSYTAYYLVSWKPGEQQKVHLLTAPINACEQNIVGPNYKENYQLEKTYQVEYCLLDHFQSINPHRKVDFWIDKFYIVLHQIYNINKANEDETIIFYDCRDFIFPTYLNAAQQKADEFKVKFTKQLY